MRHAGYGVQSGHYDTVGEALLWTLGQGMGEEFTPEVQTAWPEVYTLLAEVMQDADGTHPPARINPRRQHYCCSQKFSELHFAIF